MVNKRIGEICNIRSGLWKGKKPPFANVRILRNTNFADDGVLDFSDVAEHDVESKQLEQRTLRRGDILLEKSGGGPKQPVGRVAIFESAEGEYSFSNFTSRIRVTDERVLLPKYLWRYLYKLYLTDITASMQNQTSGIRNLDLGIYKKIKIPIPPIAQQKRIVGILDEADRLRQLRKQANDRMTAFLPALFLDIFGDPQKNPKGWPVVTLGEIGGVGQYGLNAAATKENDGVRFIRITDIDDLGHLGRAEPAYVPHTIVEVKKYFLEAGDILIARSGATAGKSYMHRSLPEQSVFAGYLIRFCIDQTRALPIFIASFLQTADYWRQLKLYKRAVAQPNVNAKQLSSLRLPLPPLSLQKKFAALAADAEVEMQKQSSATVRLEDLFQSLLARVFDKKS